MPTLRVGFEKSMLRIVHNQMRFRFSPFCKEVYLCPMQIRMESNHVFVSLLQNQFRLFMQVNVLSLCVVREVIDSFHHSDFVFVELAPSP